MAVLPRDDNQMLSQAADATGQAAPLVLDSNRRLTVADAGVGAVADSLVFSGNGSLVALMKGLGIPTASVAITPSDATDLGALKVRQVYVGGGGNVSFKLLGDTNPQILVGVPAGTFINGAFSRVMAATTATNLVGLC